MDSFWWWRHQEQTSRVGAAIQWTRAALLSYPIGAVGAAGGGLKQVIVEVVTVQ